MIGLMYMIVSYVLHRTPFAEEKLTGALRGGPFFSAKSGLKNVFVFVLFCFVFSYPVAGNPCLLFGGPHVVLADVAIAFVFARPRGSSVGVSAIIRALV